jgi:phospholipid-transporting ATPase
VCYNFYKNSLFVLPQFWFGYLSLYSGQSLYEPFLYQMYNIVFSSVPIMYFSVFIFQHKKEYYLKNPSTYYLGLKHLSFGTQIFWIWMIYGALQGMLITIIAA